MKRLLRGLAVTAPLVLAGACTDTSSDPTAQAMIDFGNAKWSQFQLAPFQTRFQGDRRVEFRVEGFGEPTHVSYVERVSCDGAGQFNLLPLYVESAVQPDPATFLMIQEQRQGFFYRYRDFAIRDLDAFSQNYQVLGSPMFTTFLGRDVLAINVVRQIEGGRHYGLTIDYQTGVVLSCAEYSPEGEVLAKYEYTSIDFQPDLDGVSYFVPSNAEVWIDPTTDDVAGIVGFAPRLPSYVPEGFTPYEVSKVEDENGKRWLKVGYTDGIEMVFYLHHTSNELADQTFSLPTIGGSVGASSGDEVSVFETGGVVVCEGQVGAHLFIVVGEAPEAELLGMIESAL